MKRKHGARTTKPLKMTTDCPRENVGAVLEYLWEDEYQHFLASPMEERLDHIFRDLAQVRGWLNDGPRIAEDYLPVDRKDAGAADHFGGCPECHAVTGVLRNDGYLNLGREHWFICHRHRAKWCAGANLISTWKEETEDNWKEHSQLLRTYREIEPVHAFDRSVERK